MPAALTAFIVALALLSIAFFVLVAQVAFAAPSTSFQTHADPASVAVREEPQGGCELAWRVVPSPNAGTERTLLHDLAVVSSSDIWVVGTYLDQGSAGRETLIMHWDGVQWSVVPHPQPGTPGGVLFGVDAASSNDVWAVGYRRADPNPSQTLILHWNGNAWSLVPSPSPGTGTNGNTLQAVSALSASDAWAVGYYFGANHQQYTLTLHWDGGQWIHVPSPGPGAFIKYLYGVDMISTGDVWAVGGYFDVSNQLNTLAIHWDGAQWTITPTPNPGTGGYLQSVSAVASNDVWAVGYNFTPNGPQQTLTTHWDGTQWTRIPSPNEGDRSNYLYGVDTLSANNVWAVGFYYLPDPNNPDVIVSWPLIERWDGTQWSIVQSPHPGAYRNTLLAVEALSINDVWAVGHFDPGTGREASLVERYSEECVTATPATTVTSTPANTPIATGTTLTPTSTATPTCQPAWRVVSSPNSTQGYNSLYGVAAASPGDVWAVGYSYGNGPIQTLTMHWNGTGWSIVPSPAPGTSSQLQEVAVVAPNDVWAVGSYTQSGQANTLTIHWNGTEWSQIASPNVGSLSNVLYGVSAVSSSYVWAVGSYSNGGYTSQTLTMRWNGSAWNVVPSPNGPVDSNSLRSVWSSSPGDIWAVGEYHPSGGGASYTLTMHWNGSQWTIIPSPNPGSASSVLNGVSGSSPNDVWAVGTTFPNGGPIVTLIEHWDGQAWNVVPSPNVGTGTNSLNAVAVVTPEDVWAVGFYITTGLQGPSRTLALRWDGQGWSVSSTLNPGTVADILNSVSAASVGDVWAVGGYQNDSSTQTLAEHYGCGAVTPTPALPTATATAMIASATATAMIATPTATPCSVQFTDVPVDHTFYTFIRCLACRNILSGYPDGTFRPGSDITRGQIAKVVSNAAGYTDTPAGQTYEDVLVGSTFYVWVERLSSRGHMNGYPCGGPGEPCNPPANRPYFRPGASATRGQLSKIVANAASIGGTPTGQHYADVAEGQTFYMWIMRLTDLHVMAGYACGGPGEPCDGQSRPYFRPGGQVTRGQSSKIVSNTFFPGCNAP